MRIGIVTNCYLPLVNGVVGAISLLRKGFGEAGHQVFIFAPAFDHYRDQEPDIYRFPAVDLTRRVKYPVAIPWAPPLKRIFNRLTLDLIHIHHPFVLGPWALTLAQRARIPVVATFHTQYEQYSHYIPLPKGLVCWAARHRVRSFYQAADQITTPSDSARNLLLNYGVTHPVHVIPNPVRLDQLQNGRGDAVKQRYGLHGSRILMNIGRIAAEKNLTLLLETFQLLQREAGDHPLKLIVVGDGPELGSLKQKAVSLGIEDTVVFTGMVSPAQVTDYLAAADLFVMTSKSEVKPLAQLEAMAAGVPVVAVAAAGANDTIIHGENGLLVPEDPAALAGAIRNLLHQPKRLAQFRCQARLTAQVYAYQKVSGRYLKLFQTVIDTYRQK